MKHKFLVVTLISTLAVLFSCLFSVSANAAATNAVFKTTEFEAVQENTFTTTFYIEANSNLIDFQIQLKYDADLVTLVSAVESENLVGTLEITPKANGVIHISYTRTSALLTAKTNLVDFVFNVNGNAGNSSYDFLTVDESYDSEAHTMLNFDLVELGMEFNFAKLTIYQAGDINLDGRVSIADVTYLRQYLASIRTLSAYQLIFADAYYDENVSISDAVRIQQRLANPIILLGDRINVTFYDKVGNIYAVKSVKYGESLTNMPVVPYIIGYSDGQWSTSSTKRLDVNFTNITAEMAVYAVYDQDTSAAITYYKQMLSNTYYSEPTINSNLSLISSMTYQGGYNATVFWSSSNSATLNSTTGEFIRPTYGSTVTLTATIVSYLNNYIEATDTIAFKYEVTGKFTTPTNDEIEDYLNWWVGSEVQFDVKLPNKITNNEIESDSEYEIRVAWSILGSDSAETALTQIERTTSTQIVTLIATVTFNGEPVEGDGRIYFDDVTLTAITEDEIRYHIINQIAANTGISLSTNESLWNDDTVYGTSVRWLSGNTGIATIANNVVTISNTAVNGMPLPLIAEVTYATDQGAKTFELSYTVSVATTNALLVPGTNIDPHLYDALKETLDIDGSLTTDALKDVTFVYLDLSFYPEITQLTGLSYCVNLRVLNISGLRITSGLNQIATLSKLEALIARDCGFESLTDGGIPVLKTMINLKLLDLSNNNFSTLNSIFDPGVKYGKLSEVFLNGNGLTDISALSSASALRVLVLSDNLLENDDLALLPNFEFLIYLSLAENNIDSITNLKTLTSLVELRLQNNSITSLRDLRFLIKLKALYLGGNNIANNFTASGSETNIYYLSNLKALKVLYLNDNQIEDVDDLSALTNLLALNVTNNKIQNLSFLSALVPNTANNYEGLQELYAENNVIETFGFVNNLTALKKLMLSGNASTYEANLTNYLRNLTQLETLTLSGKDLKTLKFLENMYNLIHLDVADCNLPAYCITSSSVITENATRYLQVSSFDDNVASILRLKGSLKFLDVSNNGFAYNAVDMLQYLNDNGYPLDVSGIRFTQNTPSEFGSLYELSKLIVFYADNLCGNIRAQDLLTLMTKLKYLSMENCGITSASWLSKYRELVYVDLAGNEISTFNFSFISARSKATLQYLYLDQNVACSFADAYTTFDDNCLIELSLKNLSVLEMDRLPNMDKIEYLNLSNTGIKNLQGSNPDYYESYTIERYKSLKSLDVSGLNADITPVLNLKLKPLNNLETVYAVGVIEDYVFYKCNITALYNLYNNGVNCYLYAYNEKYTPVAATEGALILGLLEDISCSVNVAADNLISDNNPYLVKTINDFDIDWSVSNTDNYEIVNNKLCVKDYTYIHDEDLTVTAQIAVYPGQAPVTRSFTISTKILRTNSNYVSVDTTGVADYLTRNSLFTYDVTVGNSATAGFSSTAKPVYDIIRYSYLPLTAPEYIITVGANNNFSIKPNAPLGSNVTITAEIGHYVTVDNFIADKTYTKTISIVSNTFTVTYVLNGGTLKTNDGLPITDPQQYPEEAILFGNTNVAKDGYNFGGWYTDAGLQNEFTSTVMPSANITLHAKWNAKSFVVNLDANGGNCATTSINVVYDGQYGQLPTSTRSNYTFSGWYTAANGGTEVTSTTTVTVFTTHTLYAHWTANDYTITVVSANTNQGTVSGGGLAAYGSNVTITATPKTGYSFTQWNDGNTSASRTVVVTGNATYTASFTIKTYTVTLNANGGSVSPTSLSVSHGNTTTLPTPTRSTYNFNGWFDAVSGGTQYTNSTPITASVTLYARWTLATVTVPNLIGQAYWTAGTTLQNLGLVAAYASAYNYDIAQNIVYAQSVNGTSVPVGSTVTLTYSSGAKPYAVNDWVSFSGGYFYLNSTGTSGAVWKDGSSVNGYFRVTDLPTNGRIGLAFWDENYRYGWVDVGLVYQHTN